MRGAFLDLLIAVKGISEIRFYDIVSLATLLARLETESNSNCERIVKLLSTSFFPAPDKGADAFDDHVARLVEAGKLLRSVPFLTTPTTPKPPSAA